MSKSKNYTNLIKTITLTLLLIISCYLISLLIAYLFSYNVKSIQFVFGLILTVIGIFPLINGSGGFYQWAPNLMNSQISAEQISEDSKNTGHAANYRKILGYNLNINSIICLIPGVFFIIISFIN